VRIFDLLASIDSYLIFSDCCRSSGHTEQGSYNHGEHAKHPGTFPRAPSSVSPVPNYDCGTAQTAPEVLHQLVQAALALGERELKEFAGTKEASYSYDFHLLGTKPFANLTF